MEVTFIQPFKKKKKTYLSFVSCKYDHLLKNFEAFLKHHDENNLNEYEMNQHQIWHPTEKISRRLERHCKTGLLFKMD